MTLILGLLLGATVGSVLGLIGAGGAILAVPGLVAVLGLSATAATTSSTIIVGSAALAGVIRRKNSGTVKVQMGLTFSAIGIAGTFLGTALLKIVPENIVLIIFAVLMFSAAYALCCRTTPEVAPDSPADKPRWLAIVVAATVVGILTGLLGIGGGFLIVPALVIFLKVPAKIAAGTSLVAIAANSLLAFLLRFEFWDQIPVAEIAIFTLSAIIASVLLTPLSTKLNSKLLQRLFSGVVVIVALYILGTNL
jgi:uncharacterized membrane protein YfcA